MLVNVGVCDEPASPVSVSKNYLFNLESISDKLLIGSNRLIFP